MNKNRNFEVLAFCEACNREGFQKVSNHIPEYIRCQKCGKRILVDEIKEIKDK